MDLVKYRFENELNLINDISIKGFVQKCIIHVPDYFWYITSSSTGKYHPKDEHVPGGSVLHTRRVVKVAEDFCRSFNIMSVDRDCVVAAAIMHDFCKNGYPDNLGYTVANHGGLWHNIVSKFMKISDMISNTTLQKISRMIVCHMGRFDAPFIVLDRPEIVVQLADYIASRNYINIDV